MVSLTSKTGKGKVRELAIFQGQPAFSEKLFVGRPNVGNRDRLLDRINDMLDRRWLSNTGKYVQEFERRLAEFLGVKHCIPMCNGTIALEVVAKAMGVTGEVIVPSFTFIATAHALQWQGITPVFCDIDPKTHTIDPDKIEQLITPRTTGVLGVHLWGQPCNIDALSSIAEKHNLSLMFDASHAVGCSYNAEMIGNFGAAEVFSFHATKFLNTFEGGAIATNDDALAEKMRLMKNFGFGPGYDNVIYIGTNGKMSEISAAMGVTGLESIEHFISINHTNYKYYSDWLDGIPGINLFQYNELEKNNFQYVILTVDQDIAGLSRDEIVAILHRENVIARRYFYPGCHQMEPYRSYFPNAGLLLPETEKLSTQVLSLPTGTAVSTDDIFTICQIIRFAVTNSQEVRRLLKHQGLY